MSGFKQEYKAEKTFGEMNDEDIADALEKYPRGVVFRAIVDYVNMSGDKHKAVKEERPELFI